VTDFDAKPAPKPTGKRRRRKPDAAPKLDPLSAEAWRTDEKLMRPLDGAGRVIAVRYD